MKPCFYDLHIHSCLSPCGDDQMTPPNIAGMAYIKGLSIIAVTDHNSARNVRAVMEAAQELPLTVIGGIELTTAEEVHVVCLFPSADAAEAAGEEAEAALPPFPNDEAVFGKQEVRAADEALHGTVQKLLINATAISIDNVQAFAARYGGFAYPAHIDKQSNSLLAAFGCLPPHLVLPTVEVARPGVFLATPQGIEISRHCRIVTSSDAHLLESISEPEQVLELPECSFAGLRAVLSP